jgi:MoxR-like ATPase
MSSANLSKAASSGASGGSSHLIEEHLGSFRDDFMTMRHELAKVVVGMDEAVGQVLTAAVAGGHVLIEGLPGLGKTLLAESVADVLQLRSYRIQFTPDVMPSDLLGTHVIMENAAGRRTFEYQQGPIFANLVLADQINRAPPKTQAALLEAMEGETISVATETFTLPSPFMVIATQNPLDSEGTFPLPEPQLDRFFCKVLVLSPKIEEIDAILARQQQGRPVVKHAADGGRLLEMREIAGKVGLSAADRRWVAAITASSHPGFEHASDVVKRYVRYGISPRGAQALVMAAKVTAAAEGRSTVTREDLLANVRPAFRHRILLNFEGQAENVSTESVVDAVVKGVK